MNELLQVVENFHFLRPLWLVALLPLALLSLALWNFEKNSGTWSQVIDPRLLPFLLDGEDKKQDSTPIVLLAIAWLLSCIAMAGPSWQQLPQAVEQKVDALVLVLDLSDSMNAADLSPSRIARAKYKLNDIIKRREEGLTALVVYAGGAHIVTPLTDDTETISLMIPSLESNIMPVPGSNVRAGIRIAAELLQQANQSRGHILLITDGVDSDADSFSDWIDGDDISLSILGVGTSAGAPIPKAEGGFIKDSTGAIVIPKLDSRHLRDVATTYGGAYTPIRVDEKDIDRVISPPIQLDENSRATERQFDVWEEQGPYLVLLLLPLAALAFRRGWINSVVLVTTLGILSLSTAGEVQANPWSDSWNSLWERKDQQGLKAYDKEQYDRAANLFKRDDWRGNAHFKNNNFEQAIEAWQELDTSSAHYNTGNALAKSGKLEEAIESYDKALEINPNNEDASTNKSLVEKLLEQQEQQEGDSESDKNKSEQKESDEQNSDQNSEQESEQQESEDQQSEQEKSEEQKSQEEQSEQQSEEDKENSEQDEQEQESESDSESEQTEMEQQLSEAEGLSSEEQQALQQWLRRIPDDPSSLLRKKFRYQSERSLDGSGKNNQQQW